MKKKFAGYRNRINVSEGESLSFYVHVEDETEYQADLIRIAHGGTEEGSPGLVLEEIAAGFSGTHKGERQTLSSGSFAWIETRPENDSGIRSFSFGCAVFPTMASRQGQANSIQVIASGLAGGELAISEFGYLSFQTGDRSLVKLQVALPVKRWSLVGVSYNVDAGTVSIHQSPISNSAIDGTSFFQASGVGEGKLSTFSADEVAFAAKVSIDRRNIRRPHSGFNGRLEAPRLLSRAISADSIDQLIWSTHPDITDSSIEGFWDFSLAISTRRISDLSKNQLTGRLENLPNRAVAGFRWTGDVRDWRVAPIEYGAIHFHADDIYDMRWQPSFNWTVPPGTRSGLYAARITSKQETDYLSFFVVPAPTTRDAPIAFVASTATYLAYANERARYMVDQLLGDGHLEVLPEMAMLLETPEFGASLYELHRDKSGIHYSSYLRPLLNWRPDTTMWGLNADTAILHWLEATGREYDVITDHDVHRDGVERLDGYQTVITGTHPEYLSTRMFDVFEQYLANSGRLMYMGGNGFYWRVAFSDEWPGAMEVRRAEGGTRAWFSEPGEYYHAFNGEYGGLWRNQGRPPNSLVGVGFTAQGFSKSTYYRKTEAASDPRAAFIFEGVGGDIVGDFGLRGGGAVGEEIDRYDRNLGSPAHALVLATSESEAPEMLRVVEELTASMPHGDDPAVRADLTFFETPAGGAVFSTGSIAWSGALCHNGYDNAVAQISNNVLTRFLSPEQFKMPYESAG